MWKDVGGEENGDAGGKQNPIQRKGERKKLHEAARVSVKASETGRPKKSAARRVEKKVIRWGGDLQGEGGQNSQSEPNLRGGGMRTASN